METCALGMRDPDPLVTIPERVLAVTCEKIRNGTRSVNKKAIDARERTTFPLIKSRCDGRAPQMSLCIQLFPASEPCTPPGVLAVMPDIIIPVIPTKPAPTRHPCH